MAHYLITGASSGIGAALAIELGRAGHSVSLLARRLEQLESVATQVRAAGGRAAVAAVDVLEEAALTRAVAELVEALGPVDVAVANAGGGGGPMPVTRLDPSRLDHEMRLNYIGTANTVAAVLPAMIARGSGHVAHVSSVAAWRGLAPSGGYSAAKAATDVLMESWSVELADYGIRVTSIHPAFIETPLTAKNNFPMPFLMTADKAARIIARGLARKRRNIDFPLPMVLLMRALHALPWWVVEPALRRVNPKRRKRS